MPLQTLDQLRRQREELPGVMEEVMHLFITDAPGQVRLVEAAYNERNAEELRQQAHYLRSGALALRFEWIAEQAHRLEFLAPDEFGTERTERLLAHLRDEINAVVIALQEELNEGG
jgi:HPt (histidine-containing phosphotransfer) domain-containing protein